MGMMLKEGHENTHKPWNAKVLHCLACECTFQLELRDKVTFISDERNPCHKTHCPNNDYEVTCPTPGCGAKVVFSA
jgi:hypothetical protein